MSNPNQPARNGTPPAMSSPAPKFSLGQVVATAAAVEALSQEDIMRALSRHICGDWGEVCDEDRASNEEALINGLRLLSEYLAANGTKFWIITEHDRSITTVLLPSDY
jgi:hypothetical protein